MSSTSSEVDELRQGDICMIDVFPAWDDAQTSRIMTGGKISGMQLSAWEKISRAASDHDKVLVAVCSYDCDLENPRSRWGVALAPLVPLPRQHRDYDELISSGVPDEHGNQISFSFLNSFPYPASPPFVDANRETTAAVADFSAISHMGKAKDAVRLLKSRVVYRLDDDSRVHFQTKLAMFMARF